MASVRFLVLVVGVMLVGQCSTTELPKAPDHVGVKPGLCPTPEGPGICINICSSDDDCYGNEKCCYNGCGFQCMPPRTTSESNEITWEMNNDDMQLEESLEQIRLNHIPRQRRCKSTGPRCVSDCTGKKDGDYQSCHGCDVYVSCVGGLRYDDRPCAPGGLVWDDRKKRCEYNSSTCYGCVCPPKPPCHGTGPNCIESCRGLPSGNYQSCKGCHIFVNCNNGRMTDGLPCGPKGTVWDDYKKCCSWYSNTCHPHCRHCGK